MADLNTFPDMPGVAVLCVDRGSGDISYCNAEAAQVLGESPHALCGKSLWEALGVPQSGESALAQALR